MRGSVRPIPGHDLVIGGTGMLSGLCLELAREGHKVSVVGRDEERLHRLALNAGIHPISVDYRDADQLDWRIDAAVERYGPVQRVVCWVDDDDAPNRALRIAAHARHAFCHVLPSEAGAPGHGSTTEAWQARFLDRYPSLTYSMAVLGFVARPGAPSRWLTNAEICAGVRGALEIRRSLTIVGQVDPWEERPGASAEQVA